MAGPFSLHAAALRAEFTALAPRPRSGAPAPVEVKLHYQGAGLLEGVLELTLLADSSPILRQRTQELALTAGTQTQRLLLPAQTIREYSPQTDVHLRFIGKNGEIDLGAFPFAASTYGTRNHLIGVCGAPASWPEDRLRPWQVLRSARFTEASAEGATKMMTSPMMMDPADLPASPLALCAFDLVLLEGDSFSRLREKQLAALARWVEGGGSLCVIAGGVIGEDHLRFLNQLCGKADFALDELGHLAAPAGTLKMIRAELGRLVVAANGPEGIRVGGPTVWTDATSFLWKLPPGTHPSLPEGADPADIAGPTPRPMPRVPELDANQRRNAIQQFLNNLLPESTRLIPLPVVAGILGAFVLIVGPGDWFVLGWIKRRRWTWLTFPFVAAAFTALTVMAAEHFLGAEDSRSALVITDVGRGGRVLRESRLELLFAARDKETLTELRQSLAVPTVFGMRQYWNSETPSAPALYHGQFPARAVLRQQLRQWTPQVNRLLTFETAADDSGIRWDAVTWKQLATESDPTQWFMQHAGADGFIVTVLCSRGKRRPTGGTSSIENAFLSEVSILPRDRTGLSRPAMTPSGDADLADLPVYSRDDPDACFVIAVKRLPGQIRIYRRIYREND
jgi:hypothetical protein